MTVKINALKKLGDKALSLMKIKNASLGIYLLTEREINRLNLKFRKKDKPTNVLAFPSPQNFPSPETGKKYLGEVYLCPSYIKSHSEDIVFMLIHGILHLLGFNHIKKSDRMVMEKLEKRLFSKIQTN